MTALPQDAEADLKRVLADLERQLQSARAENSHLQGELAIARDRQNASADILRSIAGASGDAERSLTQIAETSMRLFGASSATIQIAEGDGWSQIIRVGDSSKRVGAGVPEAQLKIGGRNMPGAIVAENRQGPKRGRGRAGPPMVTDYSTLRAPELVPGSPQKRKRSNWFRPQVPGLETSVSLLVMNSSSTGMPSLVLAMPRWIAGMMSSGFVTRSP